MPEETELSPETLHGYELRLLRCTVPTTPPSSVQAPTTEHQLHSLIENVLSSIEVGDYLQARSSEAAQLVFGLSGNPVSDSAERFYSDLLDRVSSFMTVPEHYGALRAVLVMCLAVAAFLAFTQANITGPVVELPKCPLSSMWWRLGRNGTSGLVISSESKAQQVLVTNTSIDTFQSKAETKGDSDIYMALKLLEDGNNPGTCYKYLGTYDFPSGCYLERVAAKTKTFGQDIKINQDDEGETDPVYKITPSLIAKLYGDWIMPLTKEVQVSTC